MSSMTNQIRSGAVPRPPLGSLEAVDVIGWRVEAKVHLAEVFHGAGLALGFDQAGNLGLGFVRSDALQLGEKKGCRKKMDMN